MSQSSVFSALQSLNWLSAEAAQRLLLRCIGVVGWARQLAAARPFADTRALMAASDELTAGLSKEEVLLALADHPRIGERSAASSATASWSKSEQSGVDTQDSVLSTGLREANIAYERQFGFRYLVCATGRSGHELLADLHARLYNDSVAELAVVRGELGNIARLRLTRLLEEGAKIE